MQTFRPHRRKILSFGAASLVATTASTLTGCASKGSQEPKFPPAPLKLVSVLPVQSLVSSESSGFGGPRYAGSTIVYVPVTRGRADVGAALGAGLLVAGIDYAIREARRKEQQQLMDALADVAFDPVASFQRLVPQLLRQRGVTLVEPVDAPAANAPDAPKGEAAAGQADAIQTTADPDARLTISIIEQGYYSSSRAGGYSPMLHVKAELHQPTEKKELIDSYSYYADWRSSGGDPRWVTTPPEITFESIEQLKAKAGAVRAGLARVVERMSEAIAVDISRRARGEYPIDH